MVYAADLHIHTALSPCGADEMTPPGIVQAALAASVGMIAICDHNAAGNVSAVQRAAGGALGVLAGMEITTAEEAHLLALFPDAPAALAAANEVAATLPDATEADYGRFGPQDLLDETGQVIGREPKLLAVATGFPLAQAVQLVHRHGGLAIAAHVNRPSFSVISQLGMIPLGAELDALEVFTPAGGTARIADYTQYGLPVIASSDSHYLSCVGSVRSELELAAPSFAELALALRGEEGRRVLYA